MLFQISLTLVGFFAGSIASIAGFGIGSLLTPLLALKTGIGLAVALVSIAHFIGTALRFAIWHKFVNKKVLLSFGAASAVGGLMGALLHNLLYNQVLSVVFGFLLVFAGLSGLSGLSQRLKFKGKVAFAIGAVSGFFGGLVGNQGGIRSAALTGFNLKQKEFVATATGVALVVDLVRVPVYIFYQGPEILQYKSYIGVATVGVVVGTVAGGMLLKRISEENFKETVSLILLLIGILVLVQGLLPLFD